MTPPASIRSTPHIRGSTAPPSGTRAHSARSGQHRPAARTGVSDPPSARVNKKGRGRRLARRHTREAVSGWTASATTKAAESPVVCATRPVKSGRLAASRLESGCDGPDHEPTGGLGRSSRGRGAGETATGDVVNTSALRSVSFVSAGRVPGPHTQPRRPEGHSPRILPFNRFRWWAKLVSNHRPAACKTGRRG